MAARQGKRIVPSLASIAASTRMRCSSSSHVHLPSPPSPSLLPSSPRCVPLAPPSIGRLCPPVLCFLRWDCGVGRGEQRDISVRKELVRLLGGDTVDCLFFGKPRLEAQAVSDSVPARFPLPAPRSGSVVEMVEALKCSGELRLLVRRLKYFEAPTPCVITPAPGGWDFCVATLMVTASRCQPALLAPHVLVPLAVISEQDGCAPPGVSEANRECSICCRKVWSTQHSHSKWG